MESNAHSQILTLIGNATARALKADAAALAPADGGGAAAVASVGGPVGVTGKRVRVNEETQAGSSKRRKAVDGAVRIAGATLRLGS